MIKIKKYLLFSILMLSSVLNAQNDTIQLKNKDILVGEVKTVDKGVLTLKTSYSDKDFKIDFNEVKGLIIQRKCLVFLADGKRRFGNIKTDEEGLAITLTGDIIERYQLEDIIRLNEIDDKFWSRVRGTLDFGFNIAKANNNAQLTISGSVNYMDRFWLFSGDVSVLNASQSDAANTKRTDAELQLISILTQKWYLLGNVSYLSNTEQALDGRINPSIGFGRFLLSSSKLYLGLSLGVTYNIENFTNSDLNKTSTEAIAKFTFNMFNFEDISLNTSLDLYPSLSEKGRFRSDYDITLKYDLPLDFYIKIGFTLNFDNQPAIAGNDFDYVFNSGIGWKFN